jgi:hypothetical protein
MTLVYDHRDGKNIPRRLKRLRKKSLLGEKGVPQGLKPATFSVVFGTTEVAP